MNSICIYYNEKRIYFLANDKGLSNLPDEMSLVSVSKTQPDIFDDFLAFVGRNDNLQLVYMNRSVKRTFEKFAANFKLIEAAGGIIKNNKRERLFIFRNGKWDLPKGKLDKGETVRKAAIRECE